MDAKQPDAGFADLALHVSERARARRVLEGVTESALDFRSTADPPLVERERALRQELSILAMQQVRLGEKDAPAARRAVADRKLRELEAQRQEILTALRQGNPGYAEVIQPSILDAREVQKALDPETALLEYAIGDDGSYVWVVRQDSVRVFRLPDAATLDALARRLYSRCRRVPKRHRASPRHSVAPRSTDRRATQAAEQLSDLILPDTLSALAVKRLVVVTDGPLQIVPFSALPLPRAPGAVNRSRPLLGSTFDLVYAPSASWVAALRRLRDGRAAPPKALALLADPVFDPLDSRVAERARTDDRRIGRGDAICASACGQRVRPADRRVGGAAASAVHAGVRRCRSPRWCPARDGSLVALGFDASRERAMSSGWRSTGLSISPRKSAQQRASGFVGHRVVARRSAGQAPGMVSCASRTSTTCGSAPSSWC